MRSGRVAARAGFRGVLRLRRAAVVGAARGVPHEEGAPLDTEGL